MATNLITPKTAAENSTPDTTVAAGGTVNFGLKTGSDGVIPNDEPLRITRKDDGGKYVDTGYALTAATPNVVITGEGAYRIEKPVTRNSLGAFVG